MVERAERRLENRMKSVELWRAMGQYEEADREERDAKREFNEAVLFAGMGVEL